MNLKISERDGFAYIALCGSFNITVSEKFKKFIEDRTKFEKSIVIDLAEVDYIDSAGISSLIYVKKSLEKNTFVLELMNVNDNIMSIFKVTNLCNYFTFVK